MRLSGYKEPWNVYVKNNYRKETDNAVVLVNVNEYNLFIKKNRNGLNNIYISREQLNKVFDGEIKK